MEELQKVAEALVAINFGDAKTVRICVLEANILLQGGRMIEFFEKSSGLGHYFLTSPPKKLVV